MRDLLLEVDGRLVPPPHEVRHDRLGGRHVAHEVAVGTPPEHGRGCYTRPPGSIPATAPDSRRRLRDSRRGRYRRRVAFAELLAHPDVVEELVLASPVGFLALHGGLEPGTAEIAREAARRAGASCYAIVQPDDLKHHVPSHENDPADAPLLAGFLDHVETVVSVHGYWGHDDLHSALLVGGGDRALAAALAARLRAALPDYVVIDDLDGIPRRLRGLDPAQPGEPSAGGACRSSSRTRCGRSARTGTASGARCTARTPRRWSRRWPPSRAT